MGGCLFERPGCWLCTPGNTLVSKAAGASGKPGCRGPSRLRIFSIKVNRTKRNGDRESTYAPMRCFGISIHKPLEVHLKIQRALGKLCRTGFPSSPAGVAGGDARGSRMWSLRPLRTRVEARRTLWRELRGIRFRAEIQRLAAAVRAGDSREFRAVARRRCCAGDCCPSWARDLRWRTGFINARSESAAENLRFAAALRSRRRCLVPVDGFYEWRKSGVGQAALPVSACIGRTDGAGGLVGVLERADGEALPTFTILTTSANALLATFHERMPVILPPETWGLWLNPSRTRSSLRR